jgi:hypothetical protein
LPSAAGSSTWRIHRASGATLSAPRCAGRGAIVAVLLLGALSPVACTRRPDDPIPALLRTTLKRGERIVLVRPLDPQAAGVAVVIDTKAGKPELRLYEQKAPGRYALARTVQEGDSFKNLSLEDLDGDGKDEIVTTWEGGHLEMIDILAQGADHDYRSIFQNAGRQVEKRYDSVGHVEFWITSRTYDEGPGQPPAYSTTVYHISEGKYVEAPRK